MRRCASLAAIVVAFGLPLTAAPPADGELAERVLLTLSEGARVGEVFVSDGGVSAVAVVSARDERGQKRLILDGHESPPFFELVGRRVLFSPDGKRVAYMMRGRQGAGGGQVVNTVFDGDTAHQHAIVSALIGSFDPTGRRFGYVAGIIVPGAGGRSCVFIDGKQPGPPRRASSRRGSTPEHPSGLPTACRAACAKSADTGRRYRAQRRRSGASYRAGDVNRGA